MNLKTYIFQEIPKRLIKNWRPLLFSLLIANLFLFYYVLPKVKHSHHFFLGMLIGNIISCIFPLDKPIFLKTVIWLVKKIPTPPSETNRSKAIFKSSIPGENLAKLAQLFFSKQSYEYSFAPLIADLQHEYCDAMNKNKCLCAKKIYLQYIIAFITAIILLLIMKMFNKFKKILVS